MGRLWHSQCQLLANTGLGFCATAVAADGVCSRKATLGIDAPHLPPVISKPDEYFDSLGLEFVSGNAELSISDLNDLFSRVSTSGDPISAATCHGLSRAAPHLPCVPGMQQSCMRTA